MSELRDEIEKIIDAEYQRPAVLRRTAGVIAAFVATREASLRSELAVANERAKVGWMAGRDAAARIADHPESCYASDVAAVIRALAPPSDPGSAGGAT